MYSPGPGGQLDDLNPSLFPPTGLFWTVEIPTDGVRVEPGGGRAVLEARDVPILDYGNIPNALFGGGPAPLPGTVSFKVVWEGVAQRLHIRNTDPVFGGFAGEFIHNSARMEWKAEAGGYTFESAPLATSSSSFAEIGHERNGFFFHGGRSGEPRG